MNVYLTYDYELFLGPDTGTVENCLLKPTNRLIEIADKHNIKMTFFIDVLYIVKAIEFRNLSAKLDQEINRIINQLKILKEKGHILGLHIHPQWFYSFYDVKNDKWVMDKKHYSLNNCTIDDCRIMLALGTSFLKQLYNTNLKFVFRAGGYSFPLDIERIKILKYSDVVIDSSVLVGEKIRSDFQKYDYSNIVSCNKYRFDNSVNRSSSNGEIVEMPIFTLLIPSVVKSLFERFARKKYGKMDVYGDGKGVGYFGDKRNPAKENLLKRMFRMTRIRASVDAINSTHISFCFLIAKLKRSSDFVVIGHPKNQSDYSLRILDKFIAKIKTNHQITVFDL